MSAWQSIGGFHPHNSNENMHLMRFMHLFWKRKRFCFVVAVRFNAEKLEFGGFSRNLGKLDPMCWCRGHVGFANAFFFFYRLPENSAKYPTTNPDRRPHETIHRGGGWNPRDTPTPHRQQQASELPLHHLQGPPLNMPFPCTFSPPSRQSCASQSPGPPLVTICPHQRAVMPNEIWLVTHTDGEGPGPGSASAACSPAPGLQENAMLRLACERTQLLPAKLFLCHHKLYQPTSLGLLQGKGMDKEQ